MNIIIQEILWSIQTKEQKLYTLAQIGLRISYMFTLIMKTY